MATETLTFPGHSGAALAGRLDLPEGSLRAAALFAHCFTCGKDVHAARRIAAHLAARGIAVLRFDFTGLGQSGGSFAATTFSSNTADLAAAARSMADRGLPPALLIGHSLGGAAVLAAAPRIGGVRAVAVIGAPFAPAHVTRHFADALADIARDGAAAVSLGGRTVTVGRDFLDDAGEADLAPAIGGLGAALLVLHAPRDAMVGIDNATRIFQAARHPKSFVALDGADHMLGRPEDAEYAAGVIAAWADRFLPAAPAEPARAAVPEGIVRVSEADAAGFLQDIMVGPHHLLADEPQAAGGRDLGPSPYGLLAAGLGACTAMTIRMYARRKGWPLAHVAVDVSHAKVHAADCADCGERSRIDRFTRRIRLDGPLDADMQARLMEIADRCPVHRTLEARAEIVTERA